MMSKYRPLGRYLDGLGANDTLLTFEDIESILLSKLPSSARRHREWWANSKKGHSQSGPGWIDYHWEVKSVDFLTGTVHFHRSEAPPPLRIDVVDMDESMLRVPTDDPRAFQKVAEEAMSDHFVSVLQPGEVGDIPKLFDFVSDDRAIVGDAKLFTLVGGARIPSAKFSAIAEHVWLLQKTSATRRFLVFGKDRRVAEAWLAKYGHLADGVEFYFLHEDRRVELLKPGAWVQAS